MTNNNKTFFAPHLYIPGGITDISFYKKAFGAVELLRFNNDDGTVHVAELSFDGVLFHIHEEKTTAGQLSPDKINGTTALIGLFVQDVDAVMASAVNAGGIVVSPAQTYDYGYRQGEVKDPFGHIWLIEQKM
jgi:PhnB protein